jgi:dynein heavy chain
VGFDFEVIGMNAADFPSGPEDGVYVKGMFLEGCAFDDKAKILCESQPKVLFTPAPLFWLKPLLMKDIKEFACYDCPVYRTPDRRGVLATTGHSTNFVMYMKVPSVQPESHWTMRGVAMMCGLAE